MAILPAVLLGIGVATHPHLVAARAARAPLVDGRLDEPAWLAAAATDAFTQKSPNGGEAPSERTSVRVLYDDDAIYVGFECDQRRSPIVAHLTRRDREVESDTVVVSLDTRADGTSAFSFQVNAAGVLVDGTWFDDTKYSTAWDENWEAATQRTDRGWSAEIRIPLRVLRFADANVQSWGLQLRRYLSHRQETEEWAFVPRGTAGEVSHYGKLDGLRGLHHRGGIEARPFVVGVMRHLDPDPDTVGRGFRIGGGAGFDLKWHISQELTLDGTVNPDFGQVEADQVFLNLSSYEQFFPEKRPFFLEGADTFATPQQLVYTRRVGRAAERPEVRDFGPFDERLLTLPEPASIYGAAKLVGNLGGRVSAGELLAITAPSQVGVRLGDGSYERRVVDPLAAFRVLRLKRELGKNAHIGVMATAVNRVEEVADYPVLPPEPGGRPTQLCPGGETTRVGQRCFHDAYAGGIDARWRSPSGTWVAEGQAIGTLIQRGPPRTQADGTVIASGDASPGGQIAVAKEGGNWVGGLVYEGHGRTLDYNDLGFMPRQNLHRVSGEVGYRWLDPWWVTLEGVTKVEGWDRENLDFLNIDRGVQVSVETKLSNFWGFYSNLHYRPAHFDDREIGDGAALERAQLYGFEFFVGTDPRRAVQAGTYTQVELLDGGYNVYSDAVVGLRVLPELDVELGPAGFVNTGEPRFLADVVDPAAYHFGRLLAESFGLTVRATYTFSPRLTLQTYAQVFLASEHFSDFAAFPTSGAGAAPVIRLSDLVPGGAPTDNPDFEQAVFNANVVLRWEYTLGSTLFIVYTHAQQRDRTPRPGDPGALNPKLLELHLAGDAVLIKLSYWLG